MPVFAWAVTGLATGAGMNQSVLALVEVTSTDAAPTCEIQGWPAIVVSCAFGSVAASLHLSRCGNGSFLIK